MPMRRPIPSMSSRRLVRLVEKSGATFERWGKGDHAIYSRIIEGVIRKAPIQMGKQSLPPEYSLIVFRQLGMTDEEINKVLSKRSEKEGTWET